MKKLLFTLLAGFTGALFAAYAGLPAAALIGSTIAVTCASFFRLTKDIPHNLGNIAFVVIGCSLGSGITHDAIIQSGNWPISLLILFFAVLAIVFTCSLVLSTFFSQTKETAMLAVSPGALAYVLALSAGGIGDIRAIVVIQSIRLLLVITTLPIILVQLGMQSGHINGSGPDPMGLTPFIFLFSTSLAGGGLLNKAKVPAAFFLAGTIISGVAHFSGLLIGRPPTEIIFVGFTITGSLVGARFSTIPQADLKKLFTASITVLILAIAISAGFSALVAKLLSLPFGQVFVAFAPGGVEAMAAMALSLGYDPAYVAVHHLFRIIMLICLLPLLLKTCKVKR